MLTLIISLLTGICFSYMIYGYKTENKVLKDMLKNEQESVRRHISRSREFRGKYYEERTKNKAIKLYIYELIRDKRGG